MIKLLNILSEWKINPPLPPHWRKANIDRIYSPMTSAFFERFINANDPAYRSIAAIIIKNTSDELPLMQPGESIGYYLRIYPEKLRDKYYNDEAFDTYEEAETFAKSIMTQINKDMPL